MEINQMEPNTDPNEEDYPIMILKNRLAKGEITAQEFDELKKKLVETNSIKELQEEEEKSGRSWTWYLLPLFFGIFGGLIAYFIVREDDKRMANYCIAIGLIGMVLWFVIWFIGVLAFNTLGRPVN